MASKGMGATAQEEGERPGPWLWQGWRCGAAVGEGGRRVNRLEVRLDDDVLDLLGRLLDLAGEEEAGRRDAEAVVAVVRLARVEAVVEDDRGRDAQLWPGRDGQPRRLGKGCGEGPAHRVSGISGSERRCRGPQGSLCRYPAAHARRAPAPPPQQLPRAGAQGPLAGRGTHRRSFCPASCRKPTVSLRYCASFSFAFSAS